MIPADTLDLVRASRAAQGLATPTDDSAVLDRLATLMDTVEHAHDLTEADAQ